MIRFKLLALLLVCASTLSAQNVITGRVLDSSNMEPLEGAVVAIKNSNVGDITDKSGEFSITEASTVETSGNKVLEISFIGYNTKEVSLKELDGNRDILITPNVSLINEVLVQTSIANKRTLRSTPVALSYIDVEDLIEKQGAGDITSVLSGRVEGLQVFDVNGKEGSGVKFNVRSGASFSAMRDPLIFIDGVKLISTNYNDVTSSQDAMSALNDLNMSDVASVEVLKGAAASASYGAEAANGVILITTKRGSSDKMSIDLNLTSRLSKSASDYDYLVNADPINDFFETGVSTNSNLSISGRSKNGVSYFSNINYRNSKSHVPGNIDDRGTIRLNLSKESDLYEVRVNSQYTTGTLTIPLTDSSRYSATWNLVKDQDPWPYLTEEAWEAIDINYNNNRFIGSIQASLTPISGLSIYTNIGLDQNDVFGSKLYPYGYIYGSVTEGSKIESVHSTRSVNLELGASYYFSISDLSTLNLALVSQTNQYLDKTSSISVQDFPAEGITGVGTAGKINGVAEDTYEKRMQGLYGEATYSYDDKLFVTAGIRRDKSNLVGSNVSSIWYPQANVAYTIDKLTFAEELKFRGAVGESGRLPHPYDAETSYRGVMSPDGSAFDYYIKGNPDIKPERTREFELGFDWGLKGHRVAFTYYNQNTDNSIVYTDLPPSDGWDTSNGQYAQNVGEVKGSGVEFSYSGTLYKTSKHYVDLFATVGYQQNEVISTGGEDINYWATTIREGLPVYAFFSERDLGATFDSNTGEYTGRDTDEEKYLGKPFPDYTGSFGVNIGLFNHLEISALFNYSTGFQIYNNSHRNVSRLGDNYKPKVTAEEGMASSELKSDEYIYWSNEYAKYGDVRGDYIQDGDFLRLSSLTASYDFTELVKGLTKREMFNNVRLSCSGNNLWLTTKYKGSDPEIDGMGASSLSRGVSAVGTDWTTVPRSRTFSTTLQVGF